MSMVDTGALPPEPPPTADPGGVPMPSEPPVDIAALAGGGAGHTDFSSQARPAPYAAPMPQGVDIDRLASEAAAIQRQKMAATERNNARHEQSMVRDRARLEEQYKAASIGPDDMKPWDADAAREKFAYDPVQAFGSLGSIFAMAASAFTNRPMENAMMGAAAAMNAVKEGNEQEYTRAYKAWQDNTKLALDRQKIQGQQFDNAVTLFNTDMKLGSERASMIAAQYGDKQMALLLDNGLYKEAIDLNQKRQKMAMDMAENMPKLAIDNQKTADLLARTAGMKPGSPEYQSALQGWQRDWNKANITAGEKFMAAAEREYDQEKHGPYSDYLQKKWTEFQAAESNSGGGNLLIGDRLKKQAIVRETEKILAANPGMDTNKALFQASEIVEQNMPGKVQERIVARESVVNQIDEALKILDKYEGAGVTELTPTGLSGMAQRLGEWTGMASPDLDATNLWQKQQLIKAGLPVALPASIKGKLNKADRADFDAIVGTGNFTNVPQAKLLLQNLKRTINRAESLDTDNSKQSTALPVPEQYKSAQDGTRFPVTKNGATSIYVKQGNRLVPAQ